MSSDHPVLPTIALWMAGRADRRVVESFLAELGYHVLAVAAEGAAGELGSAALVIVDEAAAALHCDALAELKRRARPVMLPVLVALPRAADGSPWLRRGFDDLLRQPIAKKDLLLRIETFLRLRRHSEEAMRASEAFSRSTLDAIAANICVLGADGRIQLVNRAWREFAQANGAALVCVGEGADYAGVCRAAAGEGDAETRQSAAAVLEVIEGRRESCTGEYPCHSPAARRWFSLSAVRYASGASPHTSHHTVVVHTDITARRESELGFRLTFEMAGSGMAHVAFDGTVLRVNQRLCAFLGYREEELLATSMRQLAAAGETRPTAAELDGLRMGTVGALHFEKRLQRKDGATVWMDVTIATARAGDEPLYLITVMDDITERKHAEAALRESEARFRSLTELSSDWYWEMDSELRFTRVQGTGLAKIAQQALGQRAEELPGIDTSEPVWQALRAAQAGCEAFRDLVHSITVEGERRFVSVSGEPLWDGDGRFTGYRGTAKDVTDTLRRDDELRRFRAALDAAADMVFLVGPQLQLLDFNHAACRLLGYSRRELLGMTKADFRVDRTAEMLIAEQRMLVDSLPRSDSAHAVYRRKDGVTFPVEFRRQVMDTEDGPLLVVNARDLGYQERIARFGQAAHDKQQPTELVEEALALVLEAMPGAAAIYLEPGADAGSVLLRGHCGLPSGAADASLAGALAEPLATLFSSHAPAAVNASGAALPFPWARDYNQAAFVPVLGEGVARGALGALAVRDDPLPAESTRFLAAVASMLSAGLRRIESDDRLRYLAQFDELTGLPNRALLRDRFSQAIAQTGRRGFALAVLFLDLDEFKLVNDTLGHAAGDELLKETARRLERCVRPGDTVARLAGDEFAVVLADLARAEDASLVAQKIIERVAEPLTVAGQEVFVTGSVGVALFPGDGKDVDTLIAAADAAMYLAKQSGRNAYQFFTPELNQRTRARVRAAAELRRALERNEFRLMYQPKVSLATGKPCGAEALLRWCHPQRGMVAPADFIPALEESGLIVPVGEWVLRQACADVAGWTKAFLRPLPVAVNLSARQFRRRDLGEHIVEVVREAGVASGLIELEITESHLMQDPHEAIRVLRALSDAGIRVAIDDFGTGYSSLAYLTRFPVATLKIDRSFVAHALIDTASATIVRTIIEMAKTLGFTVVAEGVETEAQAQFLRRLGCEQAQGYLFARPMPARELAAFLEPLKKVAVR